MLLCARLSDSVANRRFLCVCVCGSGLKIFFFGESLQLIWAAAAAHDSFGRVVVYSAGLHTSCACRREPTHTLDFNRIFYRLQFFFFSFFLCNSALTCTIVEDAVNFFLVADEKKQLPNVTARRRASLPPQAGFVLIRFCAPRRFAWTNKPNQWAYRQQTIKKTSFWFGQTCVFVSSAFRQ